MVSNKRISYQLPPFDDRQIVTQIKIKRFASETITWQKHGGTYIWICQGLLEISKNYQLYWHRIFLRG